MFILKEEVMYKKEICAILFTIQMVCVSHAQMKWTESFIESTSSFASRGSNPYFILEPGYQLQLKGGEEGKTIDVVISVLDQTQTVDGVETRVVEERETVDGELVEVSRNFFAIGKETNNVYYFGEEVDIYKNGKIVSHDGAWQSGVNGARYGLMIPGTVLLGSRFYQEIAPGIAMDRAEIVSMSETVLTPAGRFENCLKTEETTPMNPKEKSKKWYARGIGLIQDGDVSLTHHSVMKK